MRKYRSNASSTVRYEYGVELAAGLSSFPEMASAAADIQTINEALAVQHDKRHALHVPVIRTRAALRFGEYSVERVIRLALRAAEMEDGGRRGRICASVFPKGSRPILAPVGKRQVKPLRELVERLANSKVVGIDAYRAAWLPKLQAALASFEAAVAAHLSALTAHDEAFKLEVALREAHHDTVDRIMGQVRAAFPRDRVTQDVIFPAVEEAGILTATSEDDGVEEPLPAEPLPPADA
ncbi:hypothetical protein KEG38_02190 [Polyangium jinanense]|uniref:hypothetical protein n=1 Tax=Polyangium jinanense TaxID=2829994 RepID=UPI0023400266|nr:hypothetical protein [Polyangium jinanense]MDC3952632.1 hypothetical protein [Polyangium jinanense]